MGKLIYSLNVSLDGFIETPDHDLGWAQVDEKNSTEAPRGGATPTSSPLTDDCHIREDR